MRHTSSSIRDDIITDESLVVLQNITLHYNF